MFCDDAKEWCIQKWNTKIFLQLTQNTLEMFLYIYEYSFLCYSFVYVQTLLFSYLLIWSYENIFCFSVLKLHKDEVSLWLNVNWNWRFVFCIKFWTWSGNMLCSNSVNLCLLCKRCFVCIQTLFTTSDIIHHTPLVRNILGLKHDFT